MTTPLSNDGILTRQPLIEARDRRSGEPARADTAVSKDPAADRSASVEIGQQRLAQETDQAVGALPESPAQARQLVERVKHQIAADPTGALRATGSVNETLFEAATARPTA